MWIAPAPQPRPIFVRHRHLLCQRMAHRFHIALDQVHVAIRAARKPRPILRFTFRAEHFATQSTPQAHTNHSLSLPEIPRACPNLRSSEGRRATLKIPLDKSSLYGALSLSPLLTTSAINSNSVNEMHLLSDFP